MTTTDGGEEEVQFLLVGEVEKRKCVFVVRSQFWNQEENQNYCMEKETEALKVQTEGPWLAVRGSIKGIVC